MATLLLDTYSLFFRAFHALPPMTTSRGEPTSAVYGFSALLLKLLKERQPDGLAFAIDAGSATFRRERFPEYKARRALPPDALVAQFARLEQLLDAIGVPVFCVRGFEADDVLATLSRELRQEQRPALVVSGDRDLLQCARGTTRVLFVGTRGKAAVLYDEAKVEARFGIPPRLLPAYVALVGDASDNLPGVPGIGPGTAAKLLRGHADLELLFSHLGEIAPRVAEALREHREQIILNEELARLREDLPLPPPPHSAPLPASAFGRLTEWFTELEFKSLLPRLAALETGGR